MEITSWIILTPVWLHSVIFYTTLRTIRLTLAVIETLEQLISSLTMIETLEKLISSLKMAKMTFKPLSMALKWCFSENWENLHEEMYVSLFPKIALFWSYIGLKIGKKAKNTWSGHMYDVTAFFGGGLQKIWKNSEALAGCPGRYLNSYQRILFFYTRSLRKPASRYVSWKYLARQKSFCNALPFRRIVPSLCQRDVHVCYSNACTSTSKWEN